jgi:hypothetical protein
MRSRNPFFKYLAYLGVSGIAFFVVLGSYLFRFWDSPDLRSPTGWGVFGDYAGGILNPAFSLITIILVLHSLVHNEIVIDEARESASKDQEHSSLVAILQAHAALLNHHEAQLTRLTRERDVRIHDSHEDQVDRNDAIANIEKLVFAERAIIDSFVENLESSIPTVRDIHLAAGKRLERMIGGAALVERDGV